MNAITIAFIIGVISIICIGIWLMKGTIDFIWQVKDDDERTMKRINLVTQKFSGEEMTWVMMLLDSVHFPRPMLKELKILKSTLDLNQNFLLTDFTVIINLK